jgi:response regulator RpfG family c-di-GMP phosphodiesterase
VENTTTFIIVDDNVIDILIHKKILKAGVNNPNIIDFICAERALSYIRSTYSKKSNDSAILLLDLNMPGMSGWEFLEYFDKLDEKIKSRIKIFIISFCIDPQSKVQANLNPNVELFISKPLNKEKISEIIKFRNPVK